MFPVFLFYFLLGCFSLGVTAAIAVAFFYLRDMIKIREKRKVLKKRTVNVVDIGRSECAHPEKKG